MLNHVTLIGNLVAEPTTAFTKNNTAMVNFTVAVSLKYPREETSFIPCIAFGKTAEFVGKYILKGTRVLVTGRIQSFKGENDQYSRINVLVENVNILDAKKNDVEPVNEEF